ncbi:hypothetical protein B0H14DRAFT_3614965 [Mycena olivaceomarginata]|nr:hypothetical protein B0H14DRAFT_3614965 [Mycena olivaceomarginata]
MLTQLWQVHPFLDAYLSELRLPTCKPILALAAASTRALTINTPTNPDLGLRRLNVQNSVFSIELNHPSFNSALAIANNVNPADNNRTVGLPQSPQSAFPAVSLLSLRPPHPFTPLDNYTLTFVNITDINDVFATSGSFSIGAAVSSSSGRSTASASAVFTQSGSASQASATSPTVSGSGSPSASNSGSGPSPSPTGKRRRRSTRTRSRARGDDVLEDMDLRLDFYQSFVGYIGVDTTTRR